jgi:LAGLIDADG endonuclease
MKAQNWPYLAGLIDGEGCFSAWKYWNDKRTNCAPYYQYSCRVNITNTNLELMKKLVQHFGGGFLCKREATEKHKASYEWRPKGKQNTKLLILAVLPYLLIKAEQAKLILEWLDLGYGSQQRREEIITRLNILNQKGSVETDTLNGDEPMIQSELS